MTTDDVLRESKEVLIQQGWVKNETVDPQGQVCLAMAVNLACGRYTMICDEVFALFDQDALVQQRSGGGPYTCFRTVEFNQHPDTTKEDVLALIDRARNKAAGIVV